MQSAFLAISLSLIGACPCGNPRPVWQMPFYQTPYFQPPSYRTESTRPCNEFYECDECDQYPRHYKTVYEARDGYTVCTQVPETGFWNRLIPSAEPAVSGEPIDVAVAQITKHISGVNAVKLATAITECLPRLGPQVDDRATEIKKNRVKIVSVQHQGIQYFVYADILENTPDVRLTVFAKRLGGSRRGSKIHSRRYDNPPSGLVDSQSRRIDMAETEHEATWRKQINAAMVVLFGLSWLPLLTLLYIWMFKYQEGIDNAITYYILAYLLPVNLIVYPSLKYKNKKSKKEPFCRFYGVSLLIIIILWCLLFAGLIFLTVFFNGSSISREFPPKHGPFFSQSIMYYVSWLCTWSLTFLSIILAPLTIAKD